MTKLEKALQKLIDKEGFDETKSLLGLSTMELIEKSNCRIDLTMANDIIPELFDLGSIPFLYKNCQLSYDGFAGTVNWICDWDGEIYDEEQTESMATPFWDIMDGIPVNTDTYDAVGLNGKKIFIGSGDIDNSESFTFIKWGEEFENLASYDMWIRRFYLPKVYEIISQHLDNYRNHVD